MFIRSSKNSGSHIQRDYSYPEYAALSNQEKLNKYDELAKSAIECPTKTPEDQVKCQRAVLKLLHFYPLIQNIKREFLPQNPPRDEFARALIGSKINIYNGKKDIMLDDVRHIEKLMIRYGVDFDKAFDFFTFNNVLRIDLGYGGNTKKKIYDVVIKMTRAQLLATAQRAYISADRLNEIIPMLMQKMTCSEYKALEAKYQTTLFKNTNTGVFTDAAKKHIKDLDECVTKYETLGRSLTK